MENKDIISKIKEKAYENVNKKIEEQRKEIENKIKNELDLVSKCIDLINEKLVFKKIDSYNGNYILATADMFFEDYNKEPKYLGDEGIRFDCRKYYYEPYFKVNGESYYDVRYLIGRYEHDWKSLSKRINRLYESLNTLEEQRNEMIKRQPVIKKLLEEYTELHKEVIKDEEW